MPSDEHGQFPYLPLAKRLPDDQFAAVSAFRRLYLYSLQSERTALAIFAVYKALQKLEETSPVGKDDTVLATPPVPTVLMPTWMRDGFWLALETYMRVSKQPGITAKKRVIKFDQALADDWEILRRWFLVKSFMLKNDKTLESAAVALSRKGAMRDTLRRAYDDTELFFHEANQQEFPDHDGKPLALAFVESRDMVPTQKLLSIFTAT